MCMYVIIKHISYTSLDVNTQTYITYNAIKIIYLKAGIYYLLWYKYYDLFKIVGSDPAEANSKEFRITISIFIHTLVE